MKKKANDLIDIEAYSKVSISHLQERLVRNAKVLEKVARRLVQDVLNHRSLFIFGSGHSGILTMEIYHRAGGPSFVIPLIAEYFLPTAGPRVVRMMERMEGSASHLLDRAKPRKGEMIWLVSQSGINPSIIDLALHAKKHRMTTVAFTSTNHSQSVASRHPSKKKLYQVCDEVVDLGGVAGDAAVQVNPQVATGPLSTLTSVFLAHSILTAAITQLEKKGIHCTYTSVNSPTGEQRNKKLEELAAIRDPLLR
jgi:uncharacterized phosphosugar-binding protein